MAANATLAGGALSSATTVNVGSVVVGASTTNLAAFVHASKSGGVGTSTSLQWKPTGTPEAFTRENDATFHAGDCRSLTGYLHAPGTGTDTVRHTASTAPDEHGLVVWTVTGGTSTVRTVPTATTGTSTTPSITNANVQVDDAVFYGYSGVENDLTGNDVTVTHNTGQSQGSDVGTFYIGIGASYEVATGTSETGGGTWSESCQWREISMAIAASGAAAFKAAWARNINALIWGTRMKKNVASQVIGAQMVSASDGSAFTSTVSCLVTGDGGTQGAGGGSVTHEGNGFHSYAPTQAETNYDHIAFTFTGTGAVPATIQVYTTFPQTGDSYARLGAPAGASVSADVAAVKVDTAAILDDTGTSGVVVAAGSKTGYSLTATTGLGNQTANITGSLSGSVGSVTGAVGSVTGNVGGNVVGSVASVTAGVTVANGGIAATSFAAGAIDAASLAADAGNELADAFLDRNMATGTDSGTDSTAVRTPRQALFALRNKVSISGGTATITKCDDTTASWTTAISTTAGNPISSSDPT